MHGLIFRTIQVFVQDTYGPETWADIAARTELDAPVFEAMFHYDPALRTQLLKAASQILGKPSDALLEDVGTYLVSNPKREALRRLMRFGGDDFIDFLQSLDDLPDRARLAVSDLHLPDLEVMDLDQGRFVLNVAPGLPGFGHVLVGVLRAMADDYGALVVLEHEAGSPEAPETVRIEVIETAFAEGRFFALGATAKAG